MIGRMVRSLLRASEGSFASKHMNLKVSLLADQFAFYEVTVRSPDSTLVALFCDPEYREALIYLSTNQDWWFRRVEYLVGKSLASRVADWRDVYVNLLTCKRIFFSVKHNYTNLALVQVLFEILDLSSMTARLWNLFCSLAQRCTLEVLEYVFSRVQPDCDHNLPIRLAIGKNNPLMIKFLLAYPQVDPAVADLHAFFELVDEDDSLCSIKLLLEDSRCKNVERTALMIRAVDYENIEVALYLLSLLEVDPTREDDFALRNSAMRGNTELVRALLSNPTVDPNMGLDQALVNGHHEVVQLLLEDSRLVMPRSAELNLAFYKAVNADRVDAVRVLLADERYSPDRRPPDDLFRNGSLDMFLVLYSDRRIDWSEQGNRALKIARRFKRTKMIELLLQDERVRAEEDRINARRVLLGY